MAEIRYRFVATGYESVRSAFKGIDQAARESKKAVDGVMGAMTGARGGGAGSSGATWRGGSRAEQLAKQVERDQIRAAKRETALAERTGKQITREHERRQQAAQRLRDREAKDHERHMARMNRTQERAIKRGQEIVEQGQERRLAHIGRQVSGAVITGGAAAIGAGAALVGAAARDDIRLRDATARLAINARAPGAAVEDSGAMAREFQSIAVGTPGVRAADIAESISQFVSKTGRLDIARPMAGSFATVSSATGASVQDVSAAAADLFQKFDVKSIEEMRDAFATLTFQGKKGAFEIKDMAGEFAEMSAAADRFGIGKGKAAVATLGGLAQIARTSTGSAAEASTAVQMMFTQLVAKQGKIGAAGVDIFDKAGNTRDITKILPELIAAKGTDIPGTKDFLQEILDVRGVRAVSPLISAYSSAVQGTSGTDEQKVAAGMKAVADALQDAIKAPGQWSDVVEDSAQAQRMASASMTATWEKLSSAVGDEVTPKLMELLQSAGNLDEAIAALAGTAGVLMEAFVWLAKKMGWSSEKTDQQKLDEAKKEREKIIAKGAPSAQDAERLASLDRQIEGLTESVSPSVEAGQRSNLSKFTRTRDQFVQDYIAAAGGDASAIAQGSALTTASAVASGMPGAQNDWALGMMGETPEQKAIRQNYQAQMAAEKAGVPGTAPTLNTDEANKNLAAVSGAAAAAAEALSKLKLPGSGASIIADG